MVMYNFEIQKRLFYLVLHMTLATTDYFLELHTAFKRANQISRTCLLIEFFLLQLPTKKKKLLI